MLQIGGILASLPVGNVIWLLFIDRLALLILLINTIILNFNNKT